MMKVRKARGTMPASQKSLWPSAISLLRLRRLSQIAVGRSKRIADEKKEKENFMSEQTKPESKPDDLTKTTEPKSIELTEEDLKRVSGGHAKFKFTDL